MSAEAGSELQAHQQALKVVRRLLRLVQGSKSCGSASEVIDLLRKEAGRYAARDAVDCVSLNACRRVLRIVREEAAQSAGADADFGQNPLFGDASEGDDDAWAKVPADAIRGQVATSVSELTVELETSADELAGHGAAHIREGDVVLTLGHSHSVARVLRLAAERCRFQAIVCDSGPAFDGQQMLEELADCSQIDTSVVTDALAFAAMSRVHRCVLSAQTVFADGGLRANCGTYGLLLAAKRHSVPALVCAPSLKLAPAYHNVERNNQYLNPATILPERYSFAEVHCPRFDLVPPGLVTLFVTNHGGQSPSHLHRFLSEQYHPDDFTIAPA